MTEDEGQTCRGSIQGVTDDGHCRYGDFGTSGGNGSEEGYGVTSKMTRKIAMAAINDDGVNARQAGIS